MIPRASSQVRWSAIAIAVGLGFVHLSCQRDDKPTVEVDREAVPEPLVPLSAAFLTRATSALKPRLGDDSQILEIRATGRTLSLQMQARKDYPASDGTKAIKKGDLVQLDYVERPTEVGQPPIGRIYGPEPIPTRGEGDLKENLFPYNDVNLSGIARSFPIALLAVDPEDGKVARLVVRRYLPFSTKLRGRIFVDSPRMGGSIDVNEKGAPLKR